MEKQEQDKARENAYTFGDSPPVAVRSRVSCTGQACRGRVARTQQFDSKELTVALLIKKLPFSVS